MKTFAYLRVSSLNYLKFEKERIEFKLYCLSFFFSCESQFQENFSLTMNSFQNYQYNPWLIHLAAKLLVNDEQATSLIAHNPFFNATPPA